MTTQPTAEEVEALIAQCEAAGRDERLSTGKLYLDCAAMLRRLAAVPPLDESEARCEHHWTKPRAGRADWCSKCGSLRNDAAPQHAPAPSASYFVDSVECRQPPCPAQRQCDDLGGCRLAAVPPREAAARKLAETVRSYHPGDDWCPNLRDALADYDAAPPLSVPSDDAELCADLRSGSPGYPALERELRAAARIEALGARVTNLRDQCKVAEGCWQEARRYAESVEAQLERLRSAPERSINDDDI